MSKNIQVTKSNSFQFAPRILRSMDSDCWGNDWLSHAELASVNKAYTDDYLKNLSAQGFDSIWVHVVLRETVPSAFFPKPDPQQLALLNQLVAKAARYGVKVYAYLCEPRGLYADDPFWLKHPETRGRAMLCSHNSKYLSGVRYGMCTSVPSVRDFIEESCYNLFKKTPGLGGVFCITASEFFTHCYSHYSYEHCQEDKAVIQSVAHSPIWRPEYFHQNPIETIYKLHHLLNETWICPRCIKRNPSEVVAELVTSIRNGVKNASPDANVIAWSWKWKIIEEHPQPQLIEKLPEDVILMTDWETCGDGQKTVSGKKYPVDEYSLSYIGPCQRFKRHLQMAKARKMRVMAKLQLSSTHEMASVPYIPVPFNLAEKMRLMQKYGVDGFLGCWNLGGNISPMTKVAGKMSRFPSMTVRQAIKETAIEEFGELVANEVVAAWHLFSEAWKEYPLSVPFVWFGPLNYATAFYFPIEISDKAAEFTHGFQPLPRDAEGHLALTSYYLPNWTSPFGESTAQKALQLLLEKWEEGIKILEDACEKNHNAKLRKELNLAKHIELSARSTINIIRFYTLLPPWKSAKVNTAKRKKLGNSLCRILEEEKMIAQEDISLINSDSSLGYHPEAHVHLFTVKDLEYKIRFIEKTLNAIDAVVSN